MKDYKRLTKWEDDRSASVNGSSPIDKDFAKAINRLAELEDKIEKGVLIDLPMRDWDNAYFVAQDGSGKPYVLSTHHWEWVVFARICGKSYMSMSGDQIFEYGEDMFSTKEEAERQIANLFGRY